MENIRLINNELIQPILEGMTGQEAADVIQTNFEQLDNSKAPITVVEDITGIREEQVKLADRIEEVNLDIPTVQIGQVASAKGAQPDVNNVGSDRQIVLDFVLPDTNTVNVGETTTVAQDKPAKVTNVGTKWDAVFNFDIPKGFTGSKGEKGDGYQLTGWVDAVASLPSTASIGTAYAVGTATPYSLYVWKDSTSKWVNVGSLTEVKSGIFDGGRADSKYGGTRTIDCGGADAFVI